MGNENGLSAIIAEACKGLDTLMNSSLEARNAVSVYLANTQWDDSDCRRNELSKVKDLYDEITECYCKILGRNVMEVCLK